MRTAWNRDLYVFLVLTIILSADCGGGGGNGNTAGNDTNATYVPPEIISATIADGAINVPVDSSLAVTFSKAMLSASINAVSLHLNSGTGSVEYNAGTRTATFTPSAPLSANVTYTFYVEAGLNGVVDEEGHPMAGAWSITFTTVPNETVNPAIVSADITDGAAGVAQNAVFHITFSEAIDPATLNNTTFHLDNGTATVAYDAATFTATLTPSAPLTIRATYTLYVEGGSTGVLDLVGNPMAAAWTATFTTEGYYDVDTNGVPRLLGADYIDLLKIYRVSLFRSSAGHDFSDDFESCRSMKHYFEPDGATDWSAVTIYSPVTGTIAGVTQETYGTKVDITPDANKAFVVTIFHLNSAVTLTIGTVVAQAQVLGTHFGLQTMSDIAIGVYTPAGWKLVSYYEAITDAVFNNHVARGIVTRDSMIISRLDRDADPLTCAGSGGNFTSTGVLDSWFVLN